MATAVSTTPMNSDIENARDSATPRMAACAVASPKYAIRRHTTKQPSGPAAMATAVPASAARSRKSSSNASGTGRPVGRMRVIVRLVVRVVVRMPIQR